jgi:folate-binding protein YgfZ
MSSLQEHTICFSGADAGSFLQAQLTQDLTSLDGGGGRLAAWCSAKGRVIALGRLLDLGDGCIGLVVDAGVTDRTMQGLQRFRFRANVEIGAPPSPWGSAAITGDISLETLAGMGFDSITGFNECQRVGRLTAVNIGSATPVIELYGPQELLDGLQKVTRLSPEDHAIARLQAGIPQIGAATSEKFTPHMLNLDLLGAVSFDKGCYPGQEIVARTHYLGDSRRRLGRFRLPADDGPSPGDKVVLGEGCKVDVVNAAGRELLGVAPVGAHPVPALASRLELPYAV